MQNIQNVLSFILAARRAAKLMKSRRSTHLAPWIGRIALQIASLIARNQMLRQILQAQALLTNINHVKARKWTSMIGIALPNSDDGGAN